MRILLPTVVLTVLLVSACGGGGDSGDDGGLTIATIGPSSGQAPLTTPTPVLEGFTFPIVSGCLPKGDQLLPNAPRTYRNGFHEGLDLYESDNCTQIRRGTPVVAARDGTVVRADVNYTEVTQAELNQLNQNPTAAESLDRFRGRQVWIDHGDGALTRYAHLQGIAPGINAGVSVKAGQLIAFVGESGTPESVTAPGTENHLHFEVRIGASYLGQDMLPGDVRRAYVRLFSP